MASSSSSSPPPPPQEKYDVFLSFRVEDNDPYTSILNAALLAKNIKTYVDDLREETPVPPGLLLAIENSKISFGIFSDNHNYASATWIFVLTRILGCMKYHGQIFTPISYYNDRSHVQERPDTFGQFIERFKQSSKGVSYNTGNESEFIHDIMEEIPVQLDHINLRETPQPIYLRKTPQRMRENPHVIYLRENKATLVEWTFLLIALCLEILCLAFDQASSPSKPQYALFGMLLAIAALLTCICELVYKGKKERVELRKCGQFLWWFYHPRPRRRYFGTLVDFYGLFGSISQCTFSTVQYVCFIRHAQNPVKVSLWPAIFLICVGASKLNKNRNKTVDHERKD